MAGSERSSNLREEYALRAFISIVPGLIALTISIVLFVYNSRYSDTRYTVGLQWVLLVLSVAAIGYGVSQLMQMRKIASFDVECPFCKAKNRFTTQPTHDVRCDRCNRDIPIVDGRTLRVFEVRCGFCSTLNWYSEKSTGLICEECDREIPIAVGDERDASPAMHAYSRHDDATRYNLVLVDPGPRREEIIPVLQKMLALNRNQVKEIMDDVPMTVLHGVPKKKAELMASEITASGGRADASPAP